MYETAFYIFNTRVGYLELKQMRSDLLGYELMELTALCNKSILRRSRFLYQIQ